MSKFEELLEHYTELKYVIHPFPDQKKYLFRIYDAEQLHELYFDYNLKHSITIKNTNIYLNIGHEHFILKNVDKKLIDEFLSKKIIWGFSFLDSYHHILSGFYVDLPKDIEHQEIKKNQA